MAEPADYRFPEAPAKDPAESMPVTLDCFPMCANFWRGNEAYSLNEYVRPNRATGYSYKATTAGLTAAREPIWPTTIASTVADGSVVWTCDAAESNGVQPISNPSAVSDPTGLTIGSISVEESTKILATYSGGSVDQDHDAVFTFTLNSVIRVARQIVRIRKR